MEQGIHYSYEIADRPTFSYLKVLLKKDQEIKSEPQSMMFFEPTLELRTERAEGGFFKSLKRTLAGEKFFANVYYAHDDGWLALCPSFAGDIRHIAMQPGDSWIVFSGAYIASSMNLSQDTRFQGLGKGIMSQERLFILTVIADQGPGDLFVGANGAFMEWTLQPEQVLNVDNGHLVAMSTSVTMQFRAAGNLKTTLLSGEGFMCKLTGPGKVIIQSRNPREFAMWLYRFMPKPSSTS
ncbi:MAG: TIGR00266 family protein [Candidatus Lokiarchaeota archaeon]|nr:TIGR00266 family protein [Candidatus Lokiarchaeota archaeon]